MKTVLRLYLFLFLLTTLGGAAHTTSAEPPLPPIVCKEILTVHYGNLARRDNGVPPLR